MIKVTVRYGNNYTDIRFPCKDSELQAKMDAICPYDTEDMEFYISSVHFPEELCVLQDHFVDLDELNYLGRRLDGFFGDEHPRFAEAVKLEGATTVQEMINIACDVYRYDKLSMWTLTMPRLWCVTCWLPVRILCPHIFRK